MQRFVPLTSLTGASLLLPEYHTAAQLELRDYLETFGEQLCPLSSLAQAIIRAKDLRLHQEIATGAVLCVTYQRGCLRVTEYDLSSGDLEFSLPDNAVILVPRDELSTGYLATALNTELCRRQVAALGLGELEAGPSPIEIVSNILLPHPDTPQGKDLTRWMLNSRPLQPTGPAQDVRFVAPPFSEAEMVANAVLVSDGQILPPVTVDSPSHYLYLQHSSQLESISADLGAFPSTMTVILRTASPAVLKHAPIAGAALRQIVELFKRSPYPFAWLNLPQVVASATGLASAWAKERELRQALCMSFPDLSKEHKSGTLSTVFNENLLSQIDPEALLADSMAHGSSTSPLEYSLEAFENGLLSWLRSRQFLTPRALASTSIGSAAASVNHFPRRDRVINSEVDSLKQYTFGGATDSFVLTDPLRKILELHLPESVGYPSQTGTRPLLLQGPFGAGKSTLLAILAAVAADADTLVRNPDLQTVSSLQALAGKYRVIVVAGASTTGQPLIRHLVEGLRDFMVWPSEEPSLEASVDRSRLLGAIMTLAKATDGRGVLVLIDEFEAINADVEDIEILIALTELQATTSVRLVLAGRTNVPESFVSRSRLRLDALWKRLDVASLPEWSSRDFARQVRACFSPFLAVKLPMPPKGPGGVLLIPWEPGQVGLADPYVEALFRNLDRQKDILTRVRSQISDEIVGRIRHMFKNRIGGIRTDVRELRIAASRSPWQTDCAIDLEDAREMISRKGYPPDHYQVGAYLSRIEKALDSLTQIVDRISQYYRSGADQPTLVNVAEEVAEKVNTWKRDRQDVAVEETYDPLPAIVLIDRERFREVLDNLLTNCKEHLPVGEGHTLEMTVKVRREKVVIELSNSGPNEMPVNPKDPHVTTSKKGGTGLGLAIVDRNIREAGGRFDLFPKEASAGVTNRIELPNAHWERGGTADA